MAAQQRINLRWPLAPVLELGGTGRPGYVLVGSESPLAPADGWWAIENALPYSKPQTSAGGTF